MDVTTFLKDAILRQAQQSGECLNYMGFYSIDKVPRTFIINRWFDVRELVYQLFVEEIPAGQKPRPSCGNWACINPKHLGLVQERETKSTKTVAKIRPGASSVKSSNGTKKGINQKLTSEQRQTIIDTFFNTPEDQRPGLQSRLAKEYDVTPAMVSQLLKAWRERENPEGAVIVEDEDAAE